MARRRSSSTATPTATGSSSSSAAGATRSRRARRKSSATSSPSACSGCPDQDDNRTMNFAFTEEQEQLKQEARSFLAGKPEPEWRELTELGWLGVSVSEELGGAGLGFLEEAVLFEELGRALYAGPYFATVGLALPALGDEELSRVAAGDERWSAEVDGLVPDLASVDWVVTEDGAARAEGEELPTMDETRPLGRLAPNDQRTPLSGT